MQRCPEEVRKHADLVFAQAEVVQVRLDYKLQLQHVDRL
jgi:hypothetical protein